MVNLILFFASFYWFVFGLGCCISVGMVCPGFLFWLWLWVLDVCCVWSCLFSSDVECWVLEYELTLRWFR